jgi:hypothetical protein
LRGRLAGTELFDATYADVVAHGRGEELFGDVREAARLFFSRVWLPETLPVLYLEFPLRDDPYLDLLAIYEQVPVGARFSTGIGISLKGNTLVSLTTNSIPATHSRFQKNGKYIAQWTTV